MESGQSNKPVLKKKRDLPTGIHTIPAFPFEINALLEVSQEPQATIQVATNFPSQPTQELICTPKDQESAQQAKKPSPFSQILRHIFHQDRSELLRVSQELAVSENSIYRWMSGNTEPRIHYLKRLPKVLPTYQNELTEAINTTFHGILLSQQKSTNGLIEEIPKEIYRRVVELITTIDEADTRFWEISQVIFDHALTHLDSEQHGMAITYAHLLAPHPDGIYCMREIAMRGHEPWSSHLECNVYLGSTSLAGMAAALQHMQVWDEKENGRVQVEVDEYEKSACAIPILRGNRIAGVLIVSSTNPHFFHQPLTRQAVTEYAQLLGLAISEQNFQPFSLLHLRPMPDLSWQRSYLTQHALAMIVNYANKHHCSRQEAEHTIELELELEFERMKQKQQCTKTHQTPKASYSVSPHDELFKHSIIGQS